ncbi:MAG: MFS transporter [Gammaproteobacteria bacterium]|nr:MFS transporter [Gammaproteobacteria bacterium]
MAKKHYKIVAITAAGGALEFYDFTIYALFAPYINYHFFANTSPSGGFIKTFAVFALGYLARPIGGIFFGHLGDKFGRKKAFSLAVLMMATATLLMGCLPTYQSIGTTAPVTLIILRLIQGFSVGGEIPGAAVFTVEHVPYRQRGFAIGCVFMWITLGNTIGAGMGFLLTHLFTPDQMLAWGWRIPFITGFFLGVVSYLIRNKTIETPVFKAMLKRNKILRTPLLKIKKLSFAKLAHAFILTAVPSAIISLFLYLPTYLSNNMQLNLSHSYLINLLSFLIFGCLTVVFGHLSDRINREKLLMTGAALLLISTYPLFYGLNLWGESFVWVFTLSFALLGSIINGTYVVLLTESFPANLRYSAVGLTYSLGYAIFGGLSPLIFTWMIHYLHSSEAPALYILGCTILTLVSTYKKQK